MATLDAWQQIADTQATALMPKIRAALSQLREAYDYARQTHNDLWEFAVEMEGLLILGLTVSDLRWLIGKGYVEHACECTNPSDATRRFMPIQNLAFPMQTCFVLTSSGASLLDNLQGGRTSAGLWPGRITKMAKRPRWMPDRRELHFGSRLVKQYRVPSPNQELVLTAFEEEGWPDRIASPGPLRGDQNAKIRLHDTIKCLNRNQIERLIWFRGDGTGEGILWEPIKQADTSAVEPHGSSSGCVTKAASGSDGCLRGSWSRGVAESAPFSSLLPGLGNLFPS